jgi:hypothetical protein
MLCIGRADPGTHAGSVEADGVGKKLVAVLITFVGIFYFAVILALIVDWIRDRMDSIKKGKGYIVERNHFLILGILLSSFLCSSFSGINFTYYLRTGWSEKALMLINEFMSHDVCSSLVVLSEMEKEYKETALLEYLDEMDVR